MSTHKQKPHEIVEVHRAEILERWEHLVRDSIRKVENAPPSVIRDNIPKFLTALAESLHPSGSGKSVCDPDDSCTRHGEQRKALRIYREDDVVLEYYHLKIAILDTIWNHGEMSATDYALISVAIEEGITKSIKAFEKTA